MAQKGLIFRHRRKNVVRYAAAPFVLGIYEYQLKLMDRKLAERVDKYFNESYFSALSDSIPLLRTIPVNKAIKNTATVAPYFDAKKIIEEKKKIAVSDCICRIQKKHIDQNCDRPMEACFQFGSSADYYVDNGLGRHINKEEALEIIDKCEEAGLITQVASSINPGGLCNCCGDCCAAIIAIKQLPKPAKFVMNNYYAFVDEGQCESCSACLERCQMDAIFMSQDDTADIDLERCIGCGLCISSCPTGAIELKHKTEKDCVIPPATPMDLMMETAKRRETSLIPFSMQK
jgi:formate hydrogenlyase subunit 6/NADH:ubiquinone oxidoreductase subunit I